MLSVLYVAVMDIQHPICEAAIAHEIHNGSGF